VKGTLEKHGSNWRMRVVVGYNEKGNPIRRSRIANSKNKREAQKELAAFITEIEAGEYIKPQKMLFKDFIEEWKKKYAEQELSPSTYETYCTHIRTRLKPKLGHIKLDEIKPIHLLNFVETLKISKRNDIDEQLSNSSINYCIRVMKNIFKRAFEWQFIKKNPAENIKKLRDNYEEKQPYSLEEVQIIMALIEEEDSMYKLFFQLAIYTGLRRGELLGLEWKDIDLEKCLLTVNQTVSYANSTYHVKEPKTKSSRRTISIPTSIVNTLKHYKNEWNLQRITCGELWEGGMYSFIFTSWHGKPLYPNNLSKKWKKFLLKHNLREVNLHGLRHTSATLLLESGESIKVISSRLGHSKVGVTQDLYIHTLESADKRAANKLDELIRQEVKKINLS